MTAPPVAATTPESTQDAIRYLRDRGCHFTRCDDPLFPRRPSYPREFRLGDPDRLGMGRAWQRMVVPLDALLDSWGGVGFLPRSLGIVVIDVDQGDPRLLEMFFPPLIKAKTARGWHLYYQASGFEGYQPHRREAYRGVPYFGRRGAPTEYGVVADVLYNQHCFLHPGEVVQLAALVREHKAGRRRIAPLPAFLFDRERARPATGDDPDLDSPNLDAEPERGLPGPGYRQHAATCRDHGPTCRDLADVEIGCRECSLFDVVREWAYRQPVGDDRLSWFRQVVGYAKGCERRLRARVGRAAAIKTGRSIARWCWERRHTPIKSQPYLRDTSREKQRERGRKGGRVTAEKRRAEAAPRRRAIYDLRIAGHSVRDVAQAVGVSIRSVYRAFRLVTDGQSPGGGAVYARPLIPCQTLPNSLEISIFALLLLPVALTKTGF